MQRSLNFIFTIIFAFSLILIVQHNILAQTNGDRESPRDMVQRLHQEIGRLKAEIAKNPSSPKVGEMKSKIQWNTRKIKEIAPNIKDQPELEIKNEKTKPSGKERYSAIIKNNLFTPLGSGGEVKRKGYILTGILGKSAFLQREGSSQSFYVSEGQNFGDDAKLARVGENSVTIIHDGSKEELKLASGSPGSRTGSGKGGRGEQRQGNSSKNSRKMEAASRAEKERESKSRKEVSDGGEKKVVENDWARKMSIDELRGVRMKLSEHIEGLEKKGVTDPEEYRGAFEKMEAVNRAIAEKEDSE